MREKNNGSPIFQFIMFVLVLMLVFFLVPGIAVVAIARDLLGFYLDVGQMWTFAAVVALVFFAIIFSIRRGFMKTSAIHIITSISIMAIYLISSFGFKFDFPGRHTRYFFEKAPSTEISSPSVKSVESEKKQTSLAEPDNEVQFNENQNMPEDKSGSPNRSEILNIGESQKTEAVPSSTDKFLETTQNDGDASAAVSSPPSVEPEMDYESGLKYFRMSKEAKEAGDGKGQENNLQKAFTIFKNLSESKWNQYSSFKPILMYYLTSIYCNRVIYKDHMVEAFVEQEYPGYKTVDMIETLDEADRAIIMEKLNQTAKKLKMSKKKK
jgi:hypothetical protein